MRSFARRLDTLEKTYFPGAVPITPDAPLLASAFAVRLLDESDEDVRARAARHRPISDSTELIIIDLFEVATEPAAVTD